MRADNELLRRPKIYCLILGQELRRRFRQDHTLSNFEECRVVRSQVLGAKNVGIIVLQNGLKGLASGQVRRALFLCFYALFYPRWSARQATACLSTESRNATRDGLRKPELLASGCSPTRSCGPLRRTIHRPWHGQRKRIAATIIPMKMPRGPMHSSHRLDS